MNLYAVHHDPIRFPEPHLFKPERHMDYVLRDDSRQKFSQTVEDRPHLSFSTGRRVCVGIHLAERNLFMAVSMLLACFKFERVSDELLDVNSPRDVRAPTWTPCHYNVKLVPRHDNVKSFF
jgi:cytochrome P450